jgi:hypothetical protein
MRCIFPGTPIFLQDVQSNLIHGLFEAMTPAVHLLDPQAFTMGYLPESMYPVQLKFQVVLQCPVIQDGDPEVRDNNLFSSIFEYNDYNLALGYIPR